LKGQVINTINNILKVNTENNEIFLCRIKGKQMTQLQGEYNPLAVGDFVEFDKTNENEGMILSRLDRKNCFQRFNTKKNCNQTVVANMDLIGCVCSSANPPFRPRFVDRVLVCSKNIEVIIILNKCDLKHSDFEEERIKLYETLGYKLFRISCETGAGIKELENYFIGKHVALVGQSGVGKSTLINDLTGETGQRVGEISEKYNRGKHTTNFSQMLFLSNYIIVDTPGVREFIPPHDDPHEIAKGFVEFSLPSKKCAYEGCLHDGEKDCEVKRLVQTGEIDKDRYESYLGLIHSIQNKTPTWTRNYNAKKNY